MLAANLVSSMPMQAFQFPGNCRGEGRALCTGNEGACNEDRALSRTPSRASGSGWLDWRSETWRRAAPKLLYRPMRTTIHAEGRTTMGGMRCPALHLPWPIWLYAARGPCLLLMTLRRRAAAYDSVKARRVHEAASERRIDIEKACALATVDGMNHHLASLVRLIQHEFRSGPKASVKNKANAKRQLTKIGQKGYRSTWAV